MPEGPSTPTSSPMRASPQALRSTWTGGGLRKHVALSSAALIHNLRHGPLATPWGPEPANASVLLCTRRACNTNNLLSCTQHVHGKLYVLKAGWCRGLCFNLFPPTLHLGRSSMTWDM